MSNLENLEPLETETPLIQTRECKVCKLFIDVKFYCTSTKSKRCNKCLYAFKNKSGYFKEYYKKNRETIIAHELEKYHAVHDGIEKKKCGRKRKPIVPSVEI